MLHLGVRAVYLRQVSLASYVLTVEQHVHNEVLFLIEQCARDGFSAYTLIHYIGKVPCASNMFIIKLEPCVKLLRVEVCPVVTPIVDYHTSEDISCGVYSIPS